MYIVQAKSAFPAGFWIDKAGYEGEGAAKIYAALLINKQGFRPENVRIVKEVSKITTNVTVEVTE